MVWGKPRFVRGALIALLLFKSIAWPFYLHHQALIGQRDGWSPSRRSLNTGSAARTVAMPLHWFDVPSRPNFSFVGLWSLTEQGRRFAFLTSEPNIIVGPVHPKAMPVMLHVEDKQRWLNRTPANEPAQPYPAQLMPVVAQPPTSRCDKLRPFYVEPAWVRDSCASHCKSTLTKRLQS